MKRFCSNCRFALDEGGVLWCRLAPPATIRTGNDYTTTFPIVTATMWCWLRLLRRAVGL